MGPFVLLSLCVQTLISLIKSLGSDLYRPAFARKESADLDQNVREWLVNQYTQHEEEFDDEVGTFLWHYL